MLSFYETLNLGPQRQKQIQPWNTLASKVLFIYKTEKPPVAVKSEEDRVLTVTGQPKSTVTYRQRQSEGGQVSRNFYGAASMESITK